MIDFFYKNSNYVACNTIRVQKLKWSIIVSYNCNGAFRVNIKIF